MTGSSVNRSALADIRVLDLSAGIAGPMAAMWLGDFGAEVIRVEPTTGSPLAGEPMWGRHKTFVRAALDGSEVAELLRTADVVVTSSTEAVTAAGIEAALRAATRLVHLHVPGYGAAEGIDPLTADALMGAASGLHWRQSSFDGGPVESVYPVLSYEQGAWAAACAIAALVERESSGLGQAVVVDGMHGALVATTPTMVVDPEAPVSSTAVGPGGPNPVYSTYRCADGQWLFLGALLPKFQQNAFGLLGTSDILTDPRVGGDGAKLFTPDNRDWVRQRLADAFATQPRDYWIEQLAIHDCPVGAVGRRDEWLDHPQIVALGLRGELTDPVVGATVMPAAPVTLSATPPLEPVARRWADRPAWSGGDAGASDSDEASPSAGPTGRGPLAGVRVIDLGTILAGPFAGMLLAELGADVLKVEPPAGDSFRVTGFQYNRGQRSLAVDLRDPAGHAAFLSVVAASDVVIDNYRPGVLQRLRIDYDHLVEVRPDVISASVTGFGDVGPLAGRPGFDPILQAMSGIMAAQGGDSDPVFFTMAINDVTAACVTVVGVCAALFHRARGGGGQAVVASLAAVSTYMQSGELVRYADRAPAALGGRDYQGPSPLDHYYKTAAGFVRIHVPSVSALVDAGLLAAAPAPGEDLAIVIGDAIGGLKNDDVVSRLAGPGRAGSAAVAARTLLDLAHDATVLDARYLETLTRADGHVFYVPGRYARFSRTERSASLLPPGLGEHSRALLAESGVPVETVESLVAAGTVVEGGPMTSFGGVSYR